MKKLLMVSVILFLAAALVLNGCASTPAPAPAPSSSTPSAPAATTPAAPASAKPTASAPQLTTPVTGPKTWNLKFAHEHTMTSYYERFGHEAWAAAVEKATSGRVKITIYPNQTLMKSAGAWEGVKSGIADVAWIFTGYFPGQFDVLDSVTLPFVASSGVAGSRTAWALYQKYPEIQAQMTDVKILTVWTSEPHCLVAAKKNIKTLEDLKGLKVRMTGGPPTDMMKLLGGTPVATGMPDVYLNLQKGVMDAAQTSYEPYAGFRLWEVAPYITGVPLVTVSFLMAMNKDVWNDIPKDIQDAIMGVSGEKQATIYGSEVFDKVKKDLPGLAQAAGYKLNDYSLASDEFARWVNTAGKPVWESWVKKMNAKGIKNAQQILDDTLSLAKQYAN